MDIKKKIIFIYNEKSFGKNVKIKKNLSKGLAFIFFYQQKNLDY